MSQTASTLARKPETIATAATTGSFHQAVPAPVARADGSVDVAAFLPLVEQFERQGFARVKLDLARFAALEDIRSQSSAFFAKPKAEKQPFAAPGCVEGYRDIGPEYSMTADRPDLNESFSVWQRNRGRAEIAAWNTTCPLHAVMTETLDLMAPLIDGLFRAMAQCWGAQGSGTQGAGHTKDVATQPAVFFKEASYLQINHYQPSLHARDLLLDPHDDIHLVTLVTATEPGLEVEVDGKFLPADLARDEALIFPGLLLKLMTGGRITPLIHQVRNHQVATPRISMMYFVNPEITHKLDPWIRNETNKGIDIVERAINAPKEFGLPTLVDGAKGTGRYD
jgi:isopenicillin N synthase-like dioxygenase